VTIYHKINTSIISTYVSIKQYSIIIAKFQTGIKEIQTTGKAQQQLNIDTSQEIEVQLGLTRVRRYDRESTTNRTSRLPTRPRELPKWG